MNVDVPIPEIEQWLTPPALIKFRAWVEAKGYTLTVPRAALVEEFIMQVNRLALTYLEASK